MIKKKLCYDDRMVSVAAYCSVLLNCLTFVLCCKLIREDDIIAHPRPRKVNLTEITRLAQRLGRAYYAYFAYVGLFLIGQHLSI